MTLLFPADSLETHLPDRDYRAEVATAHDAGFETRIFDFDALARGEATYAVRRLPPQPAETPVLYRGWMIRREHYGPLCDALLAKNYRLLTDAAAYARTHNFSQNAEILSAYGPDSLVIAGTPEAFDAERLNTIAQEVAAKWPHTPLVVKDFVKSQKYAWREACFISSSDDHEAFLRVTSRFLELQGDLLQGGLVFRPFVPLREVGRHSRVDMPLHAEFRAFYWRGERLWSSPRHLGTDYGGLEPDWARFDGLVAQIDSPFWTLDVAAVEASGQEQYGAWIALEIGDGQVSGLPDESQAAEFYAALAAKIGSTALQNS